MNAITCDDCKSQLGEAEKPQSGVVCHDCKAARDVAAQVAFDADRVAVEAQKLTLLQALAVRWSSSWEALPLGRRAGIQSVIDQGV